MMYSVYIIYSHFRDRYYVGYSHNPIRRLEEHNMGATISTRSGRPWKLVYTEEYEGKSGAIKRESEIKGKKSSKYIKNLINSRSDG